MNPAVVSEVRWRACEHLQQRAEFTLVTAMYPGDSHYLHADAERRNGDGWEPNHTPHRSGVALIYLGDGFTGGVLRLPQIEQEIVPKTGMLVAFPSSRLYEHEVTTVQSGIRYTLAIWMTEDPARYEPWMSLRERFGL